MGKHIRLDNNTLTNMTEFLKRHFSVDERDTISCIECRSLAEKILSFLPTIEVSEDCISRKWLIEEIARRDTTDGYVKTFGGREVNEIILNAPSVAPSGTNVECYARNCEKNKNGKCEETDIILEFGCGD